VLPQPCSSSSPAIGRKLTTEGLALNRFEGLMDGNIADGIPPAFDRQARASGWNAGRRDAPAGEVFGAEETRMNVVTQERPKRKRQAKRSPPRSATTPACGQAATARAQVWADQGEAAALAHSRPDIVRLLNSRNAAEAMGVMSEGRLPVFRQPHSRWP
jgi:hypothetical protein